MSTTYKSSITVADDNDHDEFHVRRVNRSLFEITLSLYNRRELLSEAVNLIHENREEAHLILQNLQALTPDVAQLFSLRSPDSILNTPFRLICQSDQEHVPLDDEGVVRRYLVVSYCWRWQSGSNGDKTTSWPGDGSQPLAPWPFSQPFVKAVLAERGDRSHEGLSRDPNFRNEGIWLDQMCIRQADEDEKQASIATMDVVYRSSHKLLVVLEDVILSSDEMMVATKVANGFDYFGKRPESGEMPYLLSLVRTVQRSRWWSRAWCRHELAAAASNSKCGSARWSDPYKHDPIFIVRASTGGTFKMSWVTIRTANLMLWRGSRIGLAGFDRNELANGQPTVGWLIAEPPGKSSGSRHRRTLRSSIFRCFITIFWTKCTVPSDMLSIVLNLSGLGLAFRPFRNSHSSPASFNRSDVFYMVAAVALAAGDPSPLTLIPHDKNNIQQIQNGASWLPFEDPEDEYLMIQLREFTLGGLQHIQSITPRQISLDLYLADTILNVPTEAELWRSYEIFPNYPIRSRLEGNSVDESQIDNELMDMGRRCFLANAFKSGLGFIRRLLNSLQRDELRISLATLTADETLRPAAKRFLGLMSRTMPPGDGHVAGSPSCDVNLEEKVEIGMPADEAEDVLLLFLTWLVDIRWRHLSQFSSARLAGNHDNDDDDDDDVVMVADCLKMTDVDFSLDIGSAQASSLPDLPFRLALPVDLRTASCELHRIWVLQPIGEDICRDDETGLWQSPSGAWRLVAKLRLLGDGPGEGLRIQGGEGFWELREQQMVTG